MSEHMYREERVAAAVHAVKQTIGANEAVVGSEAWNIALEKAIHDAAMAWSQPYEDVLNEYMRSHGPGAEQDEVRGYLEPCRIDGVDLERRIEYAKERLEELERLQREATKPKVEFGNSKDAESYGHAMHEFFERMAQEMAVNSYKSEDLYAKLTVPMAMGEIFYHALKLAWIAAGDPDDKERLAEYAADVANCAYIAAANLDAVEAGSREPNMLPGAGSAGFQGARESLEAWCSATFGWSAGEICLGRSDPNGVQAEEKDKGVAWPTGECRCIQSIQGCPVHDTTVRGS